VSSASFSSIAMQSLAVAATATPADCQMPKHIVAMNTAAAKMSLITGGAPLALPVPGLRAKTIAISIAIS
jgi:hypothetical protein